MKSLADRVWSKITRTDGCWVWRGARGGVGYGNLKVAGKTVRAHRVVYEMLVGPIPDGLQLDHLCRNRLCVNPAHLDPVTQAENIRRGRAGQPQASRTQCPKGHKYDDKNTYHYQGRRLCKACRAVWLRRYKDRVKETP